MALEIGVIELRTDGRGFHEFTQEIRRAVARTGIEQGICHLFIRHTSASLVISENADPDVLADLERYMAQAVPDGHPDYRHRSEGPDDMPAHIRSVLTATSLSLPVRAGALALGTWQGVYLWEHRKAPHRRYVDLTLVG